MKRPPRFSAPFLACGVVLLLAAVGFRPGMAALVDARRKEPIDLRRKLSDFTQDPLPSFRFVRDCSQLPTYTAYDAIGTEDIVAYLYAPKQASASLLDEVLMFVTYYSDPRETIPHTPEVCYRQSGATVRAITATTIETPALAPEVTSVEARVLDIEQGDHHLTVVYVLCANGRISSSRTRARLLLGLSTDDYTYFSKVETFMLRPQNVEFAETVELCTSLLREVLTVLVRDHYPGREDLRRG